jgi:hypothetical protein
MARSMGQISGSSPATIVEKGLITPKLINFPRIAIHLLWDQDLEHKERMD